MKIKRITIKVSQLYRGYEDKGDNGIFTYKVDGQELVVRPSFQREFVYKENQRNGVIKSVLKGYPLGIMYWAKKQGKDANVFDLLDGQQRTISLCQYLHGDFAIETDDHNKFIHNLTDAERQTIENYELNVCICENYTEKELKEWFEIINLRGEPLNNQEILNAIYAGPWLESAKKHFSKKNCQAIERSSGYFGGNVIRQDCLAKVLDWIADRDRNNGVEGIKSKEDYMARHQLDKNDDDLWQYFQEVVDWARRIFGDSPKYAKNLLKKVNWGHCYNKHKDNPHNTSEIQECVSNLLKNEEITNQPGIFVYAVSERRKQDEKNLSLRKFPDQIKHRVYNKQTKEAIANGTSNCPICAKQGIDRMYDYEDMHGDHITPWSKGGRTTEENCQMLCSRCNNEKSDK